MTSPLWTPELVDQMAALYKEGFTYEELGCVLDVYPSTVRNRIGSAVQARPAHTQAGVTRAQALARRARMIDLIDEYASWPRGPEVSEERLVAMYLAGANCREIGERVGLHNRTVQQRVRKHVQLRRGRPRKKAA